MQSPADHSAGQSKSLLGKALALPVSESLQHANDSDQHIADQAMQTLPEQLTSSRCLSRAQAVSELTSQPALIQGAQGGELGNEGGPLELRRELLPSQQALNPKVPILPERWPCTRMH